MRCRGALAWAMVACLCLSRAEAADDAVRLAQARKATVGLIAGQAGSTDTEIAAELAQVLDNGTQLRVLPILGQGSVQNLADLIFLRGVDVAIVHADALSQTLRDRTIPREQSVEYITKLFQEEVHVLAQESIRSVHDLDGKPVEVGPEGSGTDVTASALLSALDIHADVRHEAQDVALRRLRGGEVAAVVVVGGEPVPALLQLPPDSGLHFLPVPLNTRLVDTYFPSRLDSQSYPNLVPQGGTVDTIAVGSMLVTLSAHASGGRRERVNRFVDALFARFDALRQPGLHPKWQEVSLGAQVPGLRRYDEAARLLRAGPSAAAGRERHSGP